VSGSGYTKTNSALLPDLFYTDPAADSGTTYYYVVTAVDSAAVESDYSVEVAVAVP
jgi:TolB protein